ncbi:MAG: hypothetical protein IJ350_08440 [Clostridia bacterium]|nr:hypothetical protein [Clostridia bacterium]
MRRSISHEGHIRVAIDEALSGLDARPTLQYRVMQEIRGEKKVKKKLSFGLVLALILTMLTVAAVAAAALNSYFTGFAQLEQKYGDYDTWPENAKVELVNLMAQSELNIDDAQVEKMNQLSGQEQLQLAESIIKDYYGSTYMSTSLIMEHELGQSMYWSYEMKALHDTLLKEYGYFKYGDWDECVLPEEGDIPLDKALEIALQVMQEKFGLSEEYFAQRKLDACFVKTTDLPEPHWRLDWWEGGYCGVEISRTGEPLTWTAPYSGITYTADTDLMAGARPATPLPTDMQEDEAIRTSRAGLTEIGFYDEEGNVVSLEEEQVASYTAKAQFFFHDDINNGGAPVWMVTFYDGDQIAARVLHTYDGRYMDTAFGQQEFARTSMRDTSFYDTYDIANKFPELSNGFYFLSAEERGRLAAAIAPWAEEYAASHPYWETSREEFYYITQKYHYGVPAEDALPQSKALELAQQEAIRLGALPETINARSAEFSYEIGDPDKPLWRILLGRVDRQDAGITLDEWSENNNCEPFVVHLDAYTGQVVKSFMVTDDVDHWEWRY